jgi:hypothetical protein
MTLFNPDYLLKGPVSKYSQIRDLRLQQVNFSMTIQFLTIVTNQLSINAGIYFALLILFHSFMCLIFMPVPHYLHY